MTTVPSLPADTPEVVAVIEAVRDILRQRTQPSGWELLVMLSRHNAL